MTIEKQLQKFINDKKLTEEIEPFSARIGKQGQYFVTKYKLYNQENWRIDYALNEDGALSQYKVFKKVNDKK